MNDFTKSVVEYWTQTYQNNVSFMSAIVTEVNGVMKQCGGALSNLAADITKVMKEK